MPSVCWYVFFLSLSIFLSLKPRSKGNIHLEISTWRWEKTTTHTDHTYTLEMIVACEIRTHFDKKCSFVFKPISIIVFEMAHFWQEFRAILLCLIQLCSSSYLKNRLSQSSHFVVPSNLNAESMNFSKVSAYNDWVFAY